MIYHRYGKAWSESFWNRSGSILRDQKMKLKKQSSNFFHVSWRKFIFKNIFEPFSNIFRNYQKKSQHRFLKMSKYQGNLTIKKKHAYITQNKLSTAANWPFPNLEHGILLFRTTSKTVSFWSGAPLIAAGIIIGGIADGGGTQHHRMVPHKYDIYKATRGLRNCLHFEIISL